MKIQSLRTVALCATAVTTLLAGTNPASALGFDIRVGGPPPPPPVVVEHPWVRPYPGAIWIAGHNEWRDGAWVWVAGYYGYPPRRGARWIPGHYHHGYWRRGHWA